MQFLKKFILELDIWRIPVFNKRQWMETFKESLNGSSWAFSRAEDKWHSFSILLNFTSKHMVSFFSDTFIARATLYDKIVQEA